MSIDSFLQTMSKKGSPSAQSSFVEALCHSVVEGGLRFTIPTWDGGKHVFGPAPYPLGSAEPVPGDLVLVLFAGGGFDRPWIIAFASPVAQPDYLPLTGGEVDGDVDVTGLFSARQATLSTPAGLGGSEPQLILQPRPENAATGGQLQLDGAGAHVDILIGNVNGAMVVAGANYAATNSYSDTTLTDGAITTAGLTMASFTIEAQPYSRRGIATGICLINTITTSTYVDFGLAFAGATEARRFRRYASEGPGSIEVTYSFSIAAGDSLLIEFIADPNANGTLSLSAPTNGAFNSLHAVTWRTGT